MIVASFLRRRTVMLRQMSTVLLPLTTGLAVGFAVLLLVANGILFSFRAAEDGAVVLNMTWAYLYALAVGAALVHRYLPMYVSHGMSRRSFTVQALLLLAVFSLLLATLFGGMWLAEIALYRGLGHQHSGNPSWVVLGVLEVWPLLMIWALAGMGTAAAVFRWRTPGATVFPVALLLVAYAQTALSSGPPLFGLVFELSLAKPPLESWVAALAVIPVESVAIWLVLRDVSLHDAFG